MLSTCVEHTSIGRRVSSVCLEVNKRSVNCAVSFWTRFRQQITGVWTVDNQTIIGCFRALKRHLKWRLLSHLYLRGSRLNGPECRKYVLKFALECLNKDVKLHQECSFEAKKWARLWLIPLTEQV